MKFKIWDKVKYLNNTTHSNAIIWEEYYITQISSINTPYLLWKEKWTFILGMRVEESDIELIEEKQPIYMVYVDWWYTPKKQYDDIEKAKTEAKRLANLERKNSFVFELKTKYEIDVKEFIY